MKKKIIYMGKYKIEVNLRKVLIKNGYTDIRSFSKIVGGKNGKNKMSRM